MAIDVRTLRTARKLTQAQLGVLLGVSQKRIARIEKCPDAVNHAQLQRILSILGCELTISMRVDWRPPYPEVKPSSVYVLPHAKLPLVKIGKANEPDVRAKMLGDVDTANSYQLIVDDESHAFRVERILHRTFNKWRIPQQEAVLLGVLEGGATEWFQSACLSRILDFARSNSDLLGCKLTRFR